MTSIETANDETPLAIVCGAGTLPFTVAETVERSGRRVVIYALRGWADPKLAARYPHQWGGLGQFGRLCRFAREHGCHDVVFIGGVVRPSLWRVLPDWGSIRVLPRIIAAYRGGDDHLLKSLGAIFEEQGFRLVGAHEIAPEILVTEGVLGAVQPADCDRGDIARGLALLDAISPFDVGQAAVVAGNHVLAVEGAEGTDAMLARIAELRKIGRIPASRGTGVLVKAPKAGQDRRFDLPSIGPQTIAGIANAGLAGVAVVAGGTVIAEPDAIVMAANRAKVFIVGIPESGRKQ
ncbi:MAG: UDP-2,3-diacylglucosamine diphosphatase LpxI [Rhizobiales bacterium]|nr:UDP-2,3-diacylglucosamine diphosphatase LpxI [Hyphomicrobiales bacterium]